MKSPIFLIVEAEPRYWEDAIVNGSEDIDGEMIPFKEGNLWKPVIRLRDGQILDWPQGTTADIHYKICDQGQYWLGSDEAQKAWKWRGCYVPNDLLCVGDNGYGDYIILKVGPDGHIVDWQMPDLNAEEWEAVEDLKHPEPTTGKVLWCVNVIGPDDIHAAPDFETAWRWASAANAAMAKRADELDVMWRCTVALWPWDETSHAEDLKRGGQNADIDFPALVEAMKRPEPSEATNAAAADVLAERRRQIEAEGWTPEHDDQWVNGEIAKAASSYAEFMADPRRRPSWWSCPLLWPWADAWWKPSDHRRNLVKAGALILAEIERLDRAAAAQAGGE